MAFVYRSRVDPYPTKPTPGPGTPPLRQPTTVPKVHYLKPTLFLSTKAPRGRSGRAVQRQAQVSIRKTSRRISKLSYSLGLRCSL